MTSSSKKEKENTDSKTNLKIYTKLSEIYSKESISNSIEFILSLASLLIFIPSFNLREASLTIFSNCEFFLKVQKY